MKIKAVLAKEPPRSARVVRKLILGAMLALTPSLLLGQSGPSLPVYQVIQPGAGPGQAGVLAGLLGIPADGMSATNGEIFFYDPTNFLAVPTSPVTDPTVLDGLLAQSPNKVPGIPIKFEQLDFAALSDLTAWSSNAAVTSFSNALANSGLNFQFAAPVVGYTSLSATYTNDGGTVLTVSNTIDTKVSYEFNLGGFPLIGPGAQVQADYGPNGNVTRLLFAARQLAPGPMVDIISPPEAMSRAAVLFPGFNGQISVQLVYYAPPLSSIAVSRIIPYYLCGGSTTLTNPTTGEVSTLNLLQQLIPATDDTNYVPTINLLVEINNGGAQVAAEASVTGGQPPYNFSWSGSGVTISNDSGEQVAYNPTLWVAQPQLDVAPLTPGSVAVSWVDSSGLFQLQTSPILQTNPWPYLAGNSSTRNGVTTAILNANGAQSSFFRVGLANQLVPTTETLGLNIVDANGVSIRQSQSFAALAQPVLSVIPNLSTLIGWGTEGPYDQDFLSGDTKSWRKAMSFNPIFGGERFYRGTFVADHTDFIDPPFGSDDTIVDTADITFYAGHGNPDVISFTEVADGTGTPAELLFDSQANHAWGNVAAEWLCLLSCEVLQPGQGFEGQPQLRWGPDFDGLHEMLGFSTLAYAGGETQPFGWGNTFEEVFIYSMAGTLHKGWPLTIQQAWFNAADSTGPNGGSNLGRTGDPAVLAPIGPGGVCDLNDYWWGMGTVGPRLRAGQIHGWYYMTESN